MLHLAAQRNPSTTSSHCFCPLRVCSLDSIHFPPVTYYFQLAAYIDIDLDEGVRKSSHYDALLTDPSRSSGHYAELTSPYDSPYNNPLTSATKNDDESPYEAPYSLASNPAELKNAPHYDLATPASRKEPTYDSIIPVDTPHYDYASAVSREASIRVSNNPTYDLATPPESENNFRRQASIRLNPTYDVASPASENAGRADNEEYL